MSRRLLLGIALATACLPKVEIVALREDGGGGIAGSSATGAGAAGTGGDATSSGGAGGAGVGGAIVGGAGAGDAGAGGVAGSAAGGGGRSGASGGGAAGSVAAGGAGGATGGSATGGGATGGGNPCGIGSVDARWADWPMPNSAGAGLPNPQSYDASVPGVVRDNVTGLVWQRAVESTYRAWADAQAYCAQLVLGGCDEWRLPTRVELVSIIDFSRRDPAIDPVAFPNTPPEAHWTASTVAARPIERWWIHFETGQVHDDGNANAALRVRCVH